MAVSDDYFEVKQFAIKLQASRVIPAVRSLDHLQAAFAAPSRVVYFLNGSVATIRTTVQSAQAAGKLPVVNIDLLEGLTNDAAAVTFLADCGVAGIISTHPTALRAARTANIFAIQRSFIIDSQALSKCVGAIERFEPDAIEVLPALIAPRALAAIRRARPNLPLIAGGLVTSLSEIEGLIRAGIDAVSVSGPALWVV